MPRINQQALKTELAKRGFESISVKREHPDGRVEVEANKLHPVPVEGGRRSTRPCRCLSRSRSTREDALNRSMAVTQSGRRRAADEHDERAAVSHSMTSSARASNVGGISRPSALAVLRLRTNSIFTACSTGRSVGLTPRRILPVEMPTRWYASARLLP